MPPIDNPNRANDTAGQLLDSILDCVLPVVKRTICADLVEQESLIWNEKPVTALSKRDDQLPIKTLTLQADQRDYVKLKTARTEGEVEAALKDNPDFDWKDDLLTLYRQHKLLVLDIIDLKFRFEFQDGVELRFPLGKHLGVGETFLEIGSDKNKGEKMGGEGKDKDGSLQFGAERIRLWVNLADPEKLVLRLAFMTAPDFQPNIDVALDFSGREIGIGVKEGGLIDGLVERILCIYGPCGPEQDGAKKQGFFDRMKTSALNLVISNVLSAIDKDAKDGVGHPFTLDITKPADPLEELALNLSALVDRAKQRAKKPKKFRRELFNDLDGDEKAKKKGEVRVAIADARRAVASVRAKLDAIPKEPQGKGKAKDKKK